MSPRAPARCAELLWGPGKERSLPSPALLSPQHQQQVVQAVERAKQVTMTDLNAAIGVRQPSALPATPGPGLRGSVVMAPPGLLPSLG